MYIILAPHTTGNDSAEYRLTTSWEWAEYANGTRTTYHFTSYATEAEALAKQAECNATLRG